MNNSVGKNAVRLALWLGIGLFALNAKTHADEVGETVLASLRLPDGFEAQRLYEVPADTQGSWVALANAGDRGLISSDQYGKLYEVAIQDDRGSAVTVQPLEIGLDSAQGLLVAFNSLFVMANRQDGQSGLYRSMDADRDGQWDDAQLILPIEGSGEHGPHAIIVAPDNKSLLICAGNHTKLPKITSSRVPQVWGEDLPLERLWDPRGHATGIEAPAGWICKVDLDGSNCELVSIGFRNQYDIALNKKGELFTFDADMEWDAGTAWYRPTRILHVTSGSDFGWRGGTGKWPTYYPDTLPAVVGLGPGSPTGIAFGTGLQFPRRYQQALFAADWSYGRIFAVHMRPQGASYVGEGEVFATAAALPVTDLIARPEDGALYFVTGGRRLHSALYRIRYTAQLDETLAGAVDPEKPNESSTCNLRAIRRRLERLHTTKTESQSPTETIRKALAQLGHSDRHLRYAARVALERQPFEAWKDAKVSNTANAIIERSVAIARCAPTEQIASLTLDNLERLPFNALSLDQQLSLLRAYALISTRSDSSTVRAAIVRRFAQHFPSDQPALDRELSRVLAHATASGILPKLLDTCRTQATVADKTHYLFAISAIADGWNDALLDDYFSQLAAARRGGGGKSYGGYIENMAQRCIDRLDGDSKHRVEAVWAKSVQDDPDQPINNAPLVKNWTDEEVRALVRRAADRNSVDAGRGQQAFAKASCFACHQVGAQGNSVGPNLTTIGNRFGPDDLATTILDPNREISDQYAAHVFEMQDGGSVIGRIVNLSGDEWYVSVDMMNPGQLETINRSQVESMKRSDNSPMPSGLLNVLQEDEIVDLFAYLISLRQTGPLGAGHDTQ